MNMARLAFGVVFLVLAALTAISGVMS